MYFEEKSLICSLLVFYIQYAAIITQLIFSQIKQ